MRVSNLLVAKEEGSSSLHAQMPKRQPQNVCQRFCDERSGE